MIEALLKVETKIVFLTMIIIVKIINLSTFETFVTKEIYMSDCYFLRLIVITAIDI